MNKTNTRAIYEHNVKELQGQLVEAHKRIAELNDIIKEQQAQLSYYKNESL